MPHILVDETLPGIRSLMALRPETAQPMCDLAEALLRDTEGLSPAERVYGSHIYDHVLR
jgi:hypothetical protein